MRFAQLTTLMFMAFLLAVGAGIIIGLTVAQEDVILKARSWPEKVEEWSAEWTLHSKTSWCMRDCSSAGIDIADSPSII